MLAALSTVEPPIVEREMAMLVENEKHWHQARLPIVKDRIFNRLGQLANRLSEADWLDGSFSAGDLLMVSVLLRLNGSALLEGYPNLEAYTARAEARPAFQRAFAAQLADFTGNPPPGP